MKDGWIGGYNGKWMNEIYIYIHLDHQGTLLTSTRMYKKKNHRELNGTF
jgi:hypothetical protein